MPTVLVRRAIYETRPDLTGVDLFSMLSRARRSIPEALGPLAEPSEMPTVAVPVGQATAANGIVAHELHAWPFAVQGPRMGLELLITDGLVMGARLGTTHTDM